MEELIRRVDTLPASQKRQARLSLTEFLSDPRNFAEDSTEQQAAQSAIEGPSGNQLSEQKVHVCQYTINEIT